MILRNFLIGCVTAIAVSSSALAQTPSESFLKSPIVLSYPSGYGGMGYDVQHLADVCSRAHGTVSWEAANTDTILTCNRLDPLTNGRLIIRWLLRTVHQGEETGTAVIEISANQIVLDRTAMEQLMSRL
jgi:hypothetical protein